MRISHVAVRVSDIDKSLAFYRDALGMPEHFRLMKEDGSVRLIYLRVAEGQFVELFPGADGPYARPTTSAIVHICLQVDDIHETYRDLTARGIVATRGEPMIGGDGAWQFHVADPDGNQVEFQQLTESSRQVTG